MKKFPYIPTENMERDAAALLAEFAQARGRVIEPPIPIEDIVEKHLKLGVEFDNLDSRFGVPRFGRDPHILGAMYFDDRRIVIDESLDPDENPWKEGRYRFTLAHEGGGHWRLHRYLFTKDPMQSGLFGRSETPSVTCRSGDAKARVEWQANFYASCLLMPKNLIISTWLEHFGNTNPRILKCQNWHDLPAGLERDVAAQFHAFAQHDPINEFVRLIAQGFRVSLASMRIRLERLGLLHRETPRQRSSIPAG